jgi:energy-coupling factor transporter transmembrane protein EcfT
MFELGIITGLFIGFTWIHWTVFVILVIGFLLTGIMESLIAPLFLTGLIVLMTYTNHFTIQMISFSSIIEYSSIYLIIGIVWSMFKWFGFSKELYKTKRDNAIHDKFHKFLRNCNEMKLDKIKDFLDKTTISDIKNLESLSVYSNHIEYDNIDDLQFEDAIKKEFFTEQEKLSFLPKLKNNISIVTYWIFDWWFSMLVFLLSDVFSKLGQFIVESLSSIYNKIGKMAMSD